MHPLFILLSVSGAAAGAFDDCSRLSCRILEETKTPRSEACSLAKVVFPGIGPNPEQFLCEQLVAKLADHCNTNKARCERIIHDHVPRARQTTLGGN